MSVTSSKSISNTSLNTHSGNFSCSADDGNSGYIWDGVIFKDTKGSLGNIKSVNCKNYSASTPAGEFNLTSVKDCETVNSVNGSITCPHGKMLRTYYPSLNVGTCCNVTTYDNKQIVNIDSDSCVDIYKDANSVNVKCPSNKVITNMTFDGITNKIECCPLKIAQEYNTKQVDPELQKLCSSFNISDCTTSNIATYVTDKFQILNKNVSDTQKINNELQIRLDNIENKMTSVNPYMIALIVMTGVILILMVVFIVLKRT